MQAVHKAVGLENIFYVGSAVALAVITEKYAVFVAMTSWVHYCKYMCVGSEIVSPLPWPSVPSHARALRAQLPVLLPHGPDN